MRRSSRWRRPPPRARRRRGPYLLPRSLMLVLASLFLLGLAASFMIVGEEQPRPGGLYREAVVGQPLSLNPLLHPSDPILRDITPLVFSGLVRVTDEGRYSGDLAAGWTTSSDGLTYTFALRERALWQDGPPVTSEDIVGTVKLVQSAGYRGPRELAELWRRVRVESLDLRTVRFSLAEPYASFIEACTLPILPAHIFGSDGSADLSVHAGSYQPIGAGPFRVASADAQGISLKRASGVHRSAYLDEIQLRYYPTQAEASRALLNGDVDGLAAVGGLSQTAPKERFRIATADLFGHQTQLFLNQRSPVLADVAVRRALALTLDRRALVEGTGARPVWGPVAASSWAYDKAIETQPDRGAAAQLLDGAGWSGTPVREQRGRPLSLQLIVAAEDRQVMLANAIAAQLATVGVRVDVQSVAEPSFSRERLLPNAYDLALVGVWLGSIDPDPYAMWHSSQQQRGFNLTGWANPRSDELLVQARTELDVTRRGTALRELQRLWLDDPPSLILASPILEYATPLWLKGIRLGQVAEPGARFQHVDEWYVATETVYGLRKG